MPTPELKLQRKQIELDAYKRALDAANIVAITDARGVITYVNDNFCKISQYTADELIGQTHKIVNSDYHNREFFKRMWAAISAGEIWKGEIRNRAKDGNIYWVDTTIVPFINESGVIEQYVSIRSDITERILAKDRKFQMLFDNSSEGLLIAKPDGKFIEVNEAYCKMLGYTHREFLDLTRADIVVNDQNLQDAMRVRSEAGSYKGVLRARRKDGHILDVETSTAIYKDENGEDRTYVCVRDITEKLQAETALRNNEHRLRSMIEYGKDIITLINADGSIKYRSPSYYKVLGYDQNEIADRLVFEKVHPVDLEILRGMFLHLMSVPDAVHKAKWRMKHQDGSYRWMEGNGTNLINDPKVGAIVCNFRDITEHVDIAERLEDSNKELNRLFNTIDEVIYSVDMERGQLTKMSHACLNVYGYSEQEFFENGKLWYEVILDEDRKVVRGISETLESGEPTSGQYRIRHRDGSIRWIEAFLTPTMNAEGKMIKLDGVNHDITEKKKSEEALLNSERRFRALIENSKDIIAVSDIDRNVSYVSPSISEVLGYSPDQIVGKPFVDFIYPGDVASTLPDAVRIGFASEDVNLIRVRHKDGSWRWLEATWSNQMDNPAVNGIVANLHDVTEKKNAEQALLDSERRFRALIEKSKEGIALSDANRKFLYVSPSVSDILGYGAHELLGTKTSELFHPEEMDDKREFLSAISEGRIAHGSTLLRARHRDGHWLWIEATVTNQLADPAVKAIVTNFRDVTDKKKFEEALVNSERRFRALIESNKEGVALSDRDRRYIYMSPSIKNILGYTPEELIGVHAPLMYHPDDQQSMAEMVQALMGKRVNHVTNLARVRHKNGQWRWIELTATNQFDDPAVNAIVTNFRDVTDKKNAEEALLDSEKRFRALIENSKDGIAITDNEWKLIYLSPSITDILGYEPDELTATVAFDLLHPSDLQENMWKLQSIIKGDVHTISDMLQVRHKDGTWRWIEATATNQFDDPAVNAMVTNFRDVTERKHAEEELEMLNQSLERKVEERTMQLQESNKALESFSYIAAHDLQAPIRVLSGYTGMIREDYGDRLGEEGLKLLDVVIAKAKHMSQLVADLLTFSRASHIPMVMGRVDMDTMVSDLSDYLTLTGMKTVVTVEIKIHPLGIVSGDQALMRQVWSNLISNALKYSSKKAKPQVEIGRMVIDGADVYYIRDNGAGFDMEQADRLFQVFQRLHGSSEFEGTGVGLALVRNIIIRHGGRIWAEGEVGQGATFYFTMGQG